LPSADFIEHHEQVTGHPSDDVDSWVLSCEQVAAHTADANVAVVEGMIGL
jgi:cobyrinic acid a,c-diamide synthase